MTGRHVGEPTRETVRAEQFSKLCAEIWYAGGLKLRGRHAEQDSSEQGNLRVSRAKLTHRPIGVTS